MAKSYFFVYEIIGNDGIPVAVNYGRRGEGPFIPNNINYHSLYRFFDCDPMDVVGFVAKVSGDYPAVIDWRVAKRTKTKSPFIDYLKALDSEPIFREVAGPIEGMMEAKRIRKNHAVKLKRQGIELLSTKVTNSILREKRPVFNPEYGMFESVAAAAKNLGVTHSYVSRLCKQNKYGWSYIVT